MRCNRRHARRLQHVTVAERKEPVADIVGSEPHLHAGGQKFAHPGDAAPDGGRLAPLLQKKIGLGQRDDADLGTGELVDERGRGLVLERGEHAEVAQRDTALQAARDHCVGHEPCEHLARLEMLVEMNIHGEVGALGKIEQRRERARRIGAGVQSRADQIGAGVDGALEPRQRGRFGKIISRA